MTRPTPWRRTSNAYLQTSRSRPAHRHSTYRLKKFVRRNKGGVLAGSAIAALLVSAIVILAVSNARIRRESAAKESSLATATETARQMAQLVTLVDYRLTEIPGWRGGFQGSA